METKRLNETGGGGGVHGCPSPVLLSQEFQGGVGGGRITGGFTQINASTRAHTNNNDSNALAIGLTTTSVTAAVTLTKIKNDKKGGNGANNNSSGGGGGNVSNKSHQFRAPQQFAMHHKKKIWNKRQKGNHQYQKQHLHLQLQQVASKADLENLSNNKNIAHPRGGGGNNGGNCNVVDNLLQQNKIGLVCNVGGGNGGVFCHRSKFFLPDKRPRKEIIIPPTKFLLGGNISDPLNLNSLSTEAGNSNNNTPATTPRQSPITTPPKVEVIIPPNIHDPLHLLDPVDSMEYEKQLISPMKRKTKSKHRHRKKKPKRRRLESIASDASSFCHPNTIAAIVSASTASLSASADDEKQQMPTKASGIVVGISSSTNNPSTVQLDATMSTDASDSFNMTSMVVDASGGSEGCGKRNAASSEFSTNEEKVLLQQRLISSTSKTNEIGIFVDGGGGGAVTASGIFNSSAIGMQRGSFSSINDNVGVSVVSVAGVAVVAGGSDKKQSDVSSSCNNINAEECLPKSSATIENVKFSVSGGSSTTITPTGSTTSTLSGISGAPVAYRDKIAKDLRLDLASCFSGEHYQLHNANGVGIVIGGSGRKRKISESSGKNKFRRLDSMDKIVSPVVPQPGAWKRPPRLVPTGARKTTRNRSTSASETELLSPVDELKGFDVDSIRADTPDIEIPKVNEKTFTPIENVASKPSISSTSATTCPATNAAFGTNQPSAQNQKPKFKLDGLKYQYGNYDRYAGYRNLNDFMDVRLQVFQKHLDLFQGKDILDIGCNVGHITIAIARTLAPKSIMGIDIDQYLIGKARHNLSMYIRIPPDDDNDKNNDKNIMGNSEAVRKDDTELASKAKKCKRKRAKSSRKNRQNNNYNNYNYYPPNIPNLTIQNDELFPISFPISCGGIPTKFLQNDSINPSPSMANYKQVKNNFPNNVLFRQMNYVLKDEASLNNDTQQYDLIVCLSVTKWIHLNFGDSGLKIAFKRMFNQLRPGGKLILEAQNWASYKKKKNLTETIYKNYRSIEFFPNKFHEYLLSNEVGFSHSITLAVPRHLNKGFSRPIQLYAKGDFTPNHVQWSDTYKPQTPYEAYRGIYATISRPINSMRGSCDTPRGMHGSYSCRQTPMHQPSSPYYNPMETGSYLPSYDMEDLNRHYVFASPLYQTVWSPPASLRNSSSHTPVFGSVREVELEESGTGYPRHVYPPNDDTVSSPNANGSAFNSIRDPDTDDSNNPSGSNHVYANCDGSPISQNVVDSEASDGNDEAVNVNGVQIIGSANGIASVATGRLSIETNGCGTDSNDA